MPFLDVKAVNTKASGAQYLFFLASGTPSWCPDCREALPAIESVFGGPDAPTLQVIQVGTRDQWKSADNQWRGPPLHVKETPCIVKLVDSREVNRLGDQACKSVAQLQELIAAT